MSGIPPPARSEMLIMKAAGFLSQLDFVTPVREGIRVAESIDSGASELLSLALVDRLRR